MFGNTFDKTSAKYGHARKVWREIRHQYPGGGRITNVAAWVSKGVVPAGTPVTFDMANKTVVALTAVSADTQVDGYTQEDARILDANTVATATVIYDGELYKYMYEPADVAILATKVPGVKFVE